MGQMGKRANGKTGMTICYFTAAGSCLYMVRRICRALLSILPLMRQERIGISDDAAGIAAWHIAAAEGKQFVVQRRNSRCSYEYTFFTA